ncbi:MAG: methylenetetrahydrofolate reductase, partial [Chloroflexi bacterium]|nr:methylenetetrahydrofolate reductase [Chloroflexota bacterium]
MVKITEGCFEATGHTSIICDFSPPRSGDPTAVDQSAIDADFISVAYNPGRAVRTNSAMLAAAIQRNGKDSVFTLATRDMNKLAVQSQLLGAQMLGLQNVVVVQGDPFGDNDQSQVASVNDYQPTSLITAIAEMNQGQDFREGNLRTPTDFCIGAAVDLGKPIEEEVKLAVRKVRAGAEFLITQPIFNVDHVARYRESYGYHADRAGTHPVYFGLQILQKDGVLFSSVP